MNFDARKSQIKMENKMKVNQETTGVMMHEKKYWSGETLGGMVSGAMKRETVSSAYLNSPRTPSSGEKVAGELEEIARYAEEVLEFLQLRTNGIVKSYAESDEGCDAAKEEYYPEYFATLRAYSNRIRYALEGIRRVGEKIDL